MKHFFTPDDIEFIDLRLNYSFHMIFGNSKNEDLLLSLVQSILPEKNIKTVHLLNETQTGLRPDARGAVYDINAETDTGERLNIEMQYRSQNDFTDRMLFYSAFPLLNSLRKGDDTYAINPICIIGITNFEIKTNKRNTDVINHYAILNEKDLENRFTNGVEFVTVELPKFTKGLNELDGPLDEWLYTFNQMGDMKSMPGRFAGGNLEKLYEMAKFAAMDEYIQREYIRELMGEVDKLSQLRTARSEGKEEGLAEGLAEGKAEGLSEGKVTAARNFKALGVDVSIICQATGLTEEEVNAL